MPPCPVGPADRGGPSPPHATSPPCTGRPSGRLFPPVAQPSPHPPHFVHSHPHPNLHQLSVTLAFMPTPPHTPPPTITILFPFKLSLDYSNAPQPTVSQPAISKMRRPAYYWVGPADRGGPPPQAASPSSTCTGRPSGSALPPRRLSRTRITVPHSPYFFPNDLT